VFHSSDPMSTSKSHAHRRASSQARLTHLKPT
jgi:hypothetical protein